jgi:hypothetical protein
MRTTPLIIGGSALLLAAGAAALPAAAGAAAPAKHTFQIVEVGARLSADQLRFEDSFRVKKSPWGEGSLIRDGALTSTTFPSNGTATSKFFFRNGRLFTKETYTMAAPDVYGIAPITGQGTCSSGTESHLGQTCTYTIKGSFDMFTRVTNLTLTGTYTNAAPKKTTTTS